MKTSLEISGGSTLKSTDALYTADRSEDGPRDVSEESVGETPRGLSPVELSNNSQSAKSTDPLTSCPSIDQHRVIISVPCSVHSRKPTLQRKIEHIVYPRPQISSILIPHFIIRPCLHRDRVGNLSCMYMFKPEADLMASVCPHFQSFFKVLKWVFVVRNDLYYSHYLLHISES